jgi:acetyl esterase
LTVLIIHATIPVRVYYPKAADRCGFRTPLLIYFHGGHVLGTLDAWDGLCCQFARQSGFVVVSVDYRLAPEHKFPAAPEDCYAAVCWAAANASTLGGDGSRLAVAGDSAGGNLAAVVCLMAKDRGGPKIGYQVLLCPLTNANMIFRYSGTATRLGFCCNEARRFVFALTGAKCIECDLRPIL